MFEQSHFIVQTCLVKLPSGTTANTINFRNACTSRTIKMNNGITTSSHSAATAFIAGNIPDYVVIPVGR
jgi:hypothetical protein